MPLVSSSKDLIALFSDSKGYNASLCIEAIAENYSNLCDILGVKELSQRINELPELGVPASVSYPLTYQKATDTQYLLDLFKVYFTSIDSKERRINLEMFAENCQKHPDEIYEVLKFLELDI